MDESVDIHMDLTQFQKLAHEGRISQVYIRRPYVQFPTNVENEPIRE